MCTDLQVDGIGKSRREVLSAVTFIVDLRGLSHLRVLGVQLLRGTHREKFVCRSLVAPQRSS